MQQIITADLIKEYFSLEIGIIESERGNIIQNYAIAMKKAADFKEQTTKCAIDAEVQTEKVSEIKADLDALKIQETQDTFATLPEYQTKLHSDELKYSEATKMLERILHEYEAACRRQTRNETEVESLRKEVDEYKAMTRRQQEIFGKMFGQRYGSEREEKLEASVNSKQHRANTMFTTHTRWEKARRFLYHAVMQLTDVAMRWKELIDQAARLSPDQFYRIVAECRNNLMAAVQNLKYCQETLPEIEFPYCQDGQILLYEENSKRIYELAKSDQTKADTLKFYTTAHKDSYLLIQWFDKVINERIVRDMKRVRSKLDKQKMKLRIERIRLLKEKSPKNLLSLLESEERKVVEQATNTVNELPTKTTADCEIQAEPAQSNQVEMMVNTELLDEDCEKVLAELPPPPTEEELFGKASEITTKHDKMKEKLDENLETGKSKMQRELEQRLKKRKLSMIRDQSLIISKLVENTNVVSDSDSEEDKILYH